jgi:hypothetical protein
MKYPGFFGGSAPAQSPIASDMQVMNLYVEKRTSQQQGRGAQSTDAYYPTPGSTPWATAADVGTRGALSVDNQHWLVIGPWLYEITGVGVVTRRGIQMAQDANLAQIAYNGPVGGQLLVASGGNAYCYEIATDTMTQVLTGEAMQIGMLDGFFLAFANNQFRISDLNDGLTWDPLQFAVRSAQADPWEAMIVTSPDIFLPGELTGDVWYDSGASPFPFAPRQGLSLEYGTRAPFSLSLYLDSPWWLTHNSDGGGEIVLARGYTPQLISTPELTTALAEYARTASLDDAETFTYQQAGHTFGVVRFLAANHCWVYDFTTQLWAERGKWNSRTNTFDVWPARVHMHAFETHLVGEAATGVISELDTTVATEADGSAIRRVIRPPMLIAEMAQLDLWRFELVLEVGLGLQTGQGSDPLIMFRVSRDGGKTWGNYRTASVGRVGEYRRRVFWTRLGQARMWVPEISFSEPIPLRIIDALLNNDGADEEAA